MNETYESVTTPSIDLTYYFNVFIDFISNSFPAFFGISKSLIGIIVGLSIPISVLLLIGIVIAVEGLKSIRKKEDEIYSAKIEEAYIENKEDLELGRRWRKIVEESNSDNPNDWKQSIIDADVILSDLVTRLGYRGDGIGEKLKRVEKGDFATIDKAWEAHRARNDIAHGNNGSSLTREEAKRIINLYRQVFEEFYHIS